MGLETKCKAKIEGREYEGKLHVDSKEIHFSCREKKWSHLVGATVAAKVSKGCLVIGSGKQAVSFELGEESEKWLTKVLNPPSRMKKLGIKAEQKICLQGKFDSEFLSEVVGSGASVVKSIAAADLVLAIAETTEGLLGLSKSIEKLETGKSIWILWPKGLQEIKDSRVIEFCKSFGMGPGKSCSFDDRLTAMRFTRR